MRAAAVVRLNSPIADRLSCCLQAYQSYQWETEQASEEEEAVEEAVASSR